MVTMLILGASLSTRGCYDILEGSQPSGKEKVRLPGGSAPHFVNISANLSVSFKDIKNTSYSL
jgi:hypothetical protein